VRVVVAHKSCSQGYTIYLQINENNLDKMLEFGYKLFENPSLKCKDYTFSNCPKGCRKQCKSSVCSEGPDPDCTDDCDGVDSCTDFEFLEKNTKITKNSSLSDFKGKKSLIVFAGKFCPHCVSSMPEIKKIADKYGDKINVWINVVDFEKKGAFDIDLPQGFNENLQYDEIIGKDCGVVPSWVLLDIDGKVLIKSCGGDKKMSEIILELDKK